MGKDAGTVIALDERVMETRAPPPPAIKALEDKEDVPLLFASKLLKDEPPVLNMRLPALLNSIERPPADATALDRRHVRGYPIEMPPSFWRRWSSSSTISSSSSSALSCHPLARFWSAENRGIRMADAEAEWLIIEPFAQ